MLATGNPELSVSKDTLRRSLNISASFAGIVGEQAFPESRLRLMLERMEYGERTVAGQYYDPEMNLALGWVTPKSGSQQIWPVWNETGDRGVVIFGDVYGGGAEGQIGPSGSGGIGSKTADEILQTYEHSGETAFLRLNGWFGGILIDRRDRKIVLFNDRYGLFRIHYHQNSGGMYFSSEAKAILAAVPETREFDYQSLAELVTCNCVMQNRSMFSGISLLPGGAAWVIRRSGPPEKRTYFDIREWEEQPALKLPDYYEELKKTWSSSLKRYFAGDGKLGLSLTGGVDSRMILAWTPARQGTVQCYTFAGTYRESADVAVAREIARLSNQPHQTIPIDESFFAAFPDLAEHCVYLSDGTMDVTGSIDLFVQAAACRIAPVRITGTNGGEIMRSLVAFKPAKLHFEVFSPEFRRWIGTASETYIGEVRGNPLSFTAFKQAPWYMNGKFTVERSQIRLRMPYFDNDLVSLVYRAPGNLPQGNEIALRLVADGNPALARVGTDRGLAVRPIPLVTKSRHLYQQFTFKLEYAFDYGMPNWLARLDRFLRPLNLPRHILGRHKFHHFRLWYREELSTYLEEMLLDRRTLQRPYLIGSVLERMVQEHIAGTANYTSEFHKILTSEIIQRRFLDA